MSFLGYVCTGICPFLCKLPKASASPLELALHGMWRICPRCGALDKGGVHVLMASDRPQSPSLLMTTCPDAWDVNKGGCIPPHWWTARAGMLLRSLIFSSHSSPSSSTMLLSQSIMLLSSSIIMLSSMPIVCCPCSTCCCHPPAYCCPHPSFCSSYASCCLPHCPSRWRQSQRLSHMSSRLVWKHAAYTAHPLPMVPSPQLTGYWTDVRLLGQLMLDY
jgi:hypothetical protein